MRYFAGLVKLMRYPDLPFMQTHLKFKWEWRVEYQENLSHDNHRGVKLPDGSDWWVDKAQNYTSRKLARSWFAFIKESTWTRDVVMKRRLVQVNWETYDDSFSGKR